MFTEPQTVTVNAIVSNLPRVAFADRSGTFQAPDGGLSLKIAHDLRNRNRRTVRLDFVKTAADPLLDGVSRQYTMSAYVVVDHPKVGYSNTEVENNLKALKDWLATTGNITKVIGGES